MLRELLDAQADLPGFRKDLTHVVEHIAHGRSVLVLVPPHTSVSVVVGGLDRELSKRSYGHQYLEFERGDQKSVLTALWQEYGESGRPAPSRLGAILNAGCLPEVLLLDASGLTEAAHFLGWRDVINEWGHHSQSQPESPAVLVVGAASPLLEADITSNVKLAIHKWSGCSPSELRFLLRGRHDDEVAGLWREHVLVSVTGGDSSLLQLLWDPILGDLANLGSPLRAHASDLGWSKGQLREWGLVDLRFRLPAESSATAQDNRLWARGVLTHTPEHGVELHPAALAALGLDDLLKHRVWRGQLSLLLPLVDQVRLHMCALLTAKYGRDWAYRWAQPETEEELNDVRSDPFLCELRHLLTLLRTHSHRFQAESRYATLLDNCRRLRNRVAHNQPISFDQFRTLWAQFVACKLAARVA